MGNAGLKTTSWWSLGCHFTENGYPSLRYPNMAKVNIHEHRTRVTRFKPLKCLWLLETGFNSYHSSQREAWLRAAEIYKCLREQRGSGMNRSRLQNQVTNMDFHVSLGDTKSGDPYGFPCITWYLQWRHQVDLIRFLLRRSAKEKDSRRSGKLTFFDKIGDAKSVGFRFYSAIWRSKSRISPRYLEITSISLIFPRKKELLSWLSWGLNRLTCVTRQIRGDSKLSD